MITFFLYRTALWLLSSPANAALLLSKRYQETSPHDPHQVESGPSQTMDVFVVVMGTDSYRSKHLRDDNKQAGFSRISFIRAGRLASAAVRVEVRGRDYSSWEPRVQDGIHSIQFPLQA